MLCLPPVWLSYIKTGRAALGQDAGAHKSSQSSLHCSESCGGQRGRLRETHDATMCWLLGGDGGGTPGAQMFWQQGACRPSCCVGSTWMGSMVVEGPNSDSACPVICLWDTMR